MFDIIGLAWSPFVRLLSRLSSPGKRAVAGISQVGQCIMPEEGVFARVLQGGQVGAAKDKMPKEVTLLATFKQKEK